MRLSTARLTPTGTRAAHPDGMEEASLYLRLGGASGVEAVVRKLHQRLRADPDFAALTDGPRGDKLRDADTRFLTQVLSAPESITAEDASPVSASAVVRGHLRDALWLLGTSATLTQQIVDAVANANASRSPTSGNVAP
jgi:truncated hemoglobin YjbI